MDQLPKHSIHLENYRFLIWKKKAACQSVVHFFLASRQKRSFPNFNLSKHEFFSTAIYFFFQIFKFSYILCHWLITAFITVYFWCIFFLMFFFTTQFKVNPNNTHLYSPVWIHWITGQVNRHCLFTTMKVKKDWQSNKTTT